MPKDYRKSSRPAGRKRTNTRSNKASNTFLHGPSFVVGVVVGALLFIAGAYAPEVFDRTPLAVNPPATTPEPTVEFEFPKLLRESEVAANTQPYDEDLAEAEPAVPTEFLIQAASFQDADDAETLRAELLLQDMPVTMTRVTLTDGNWYRVVVGPFDNTTEASRMLSKLREQDLKAIMLRKTVQH